MKILITYVPAGSGHQRAAEALFFPLQGKGKPVEPVLVDAIQWADPFFRWCFGRGYLGMIQNAPLLWGISYHLTDLKLFSRSVQVLHHLSNAWHAAALEKLFLESKADWIIGTHFLPMEVAGSLKARGRLSARLMTVITDYRPHTLWIAPGIDEYAVGSESTRQELIRRGVPEQRIRVLGIPVDPKFSQPLDRSALIQRLGLEAGRFTILVGSGGAGTGPIVPLVQLLAGIQESIQLMIVAGQNETLFRNLERMRPQVRHPMKTFGFINNMEELMGASDLMVSKPGGLTCAEAMVKGLPLILTEPIPGQESRNAQFLAREKAALLASRLEEIPGLIQNLIRDPESLRQLGERARQLGQPDAADRIARLVLE